MRRRLSNIRSILASRSIAPGREDGQTVAEYALLLGLIALLVAGGVIFLSSQISSVISAIGTTIGSTI
jgi:Flp pilus assembly pilin Flp